MASSKWGNYVGAPRVLDHAVAAYGIDFANLPRNSKAKGGVCGVHKIHHIREYIEADNANGAYSSVLSGQLVFTAQNVTLDTSVSVTVPGSVSTFSAVCVGGGGAGGGNNGLSGPGASGGGGGGLAWSASIPNGTVVVTVGSGGAGGNASGVGGPTLGQGSGIYVSGINRLYADGGSPGNDNVTSGLGGSGGAGGGPDYGGGGLGGNGGPARNNGGGAGGGGAGGYSGSGGNENQNGSGGGGAGGAAANGTASRNAAQCGGGVGLYGEGASGSGSGNSGSQLGPASGVGSQTLGAQSFPGSPGQAPTFGGGGGAIEDDTNSHGFNGGSGGVRIIWGAGRSYPSTNVLDV